MTTITSGYGGPSASALSQMRQQMFAKLDSDSSGGVDETEFLQGLSGGTSTNGVSEAKLKEAFGAFDGDGDGSLTQAEVSTGFQKLGSAVRATLIGQQEAGPRGGPGGPGGAPGGPGGAGGRPSGADMLAKLDTDESGGLDEAEFIAGAPQDGPGMNGGPDEAELKEMFAAFDTDSDGALSADELSAGFESRGPGGKQGAGGKQGPSAPPPPQAQAGGSDSAEEENPFLSLLAKSGESSVSKSDLASLLASFAKLTQSGQLSGLSATA